jgi:NAD+ synthase (glutamine-hydrolysing)
MDTRIRIAMAQVNPIVGDLRYNKNLILTNIQRAYDQGAHIVTFPELVVPGYPPEDLLLKESFLEACRESVEEIAQQVKDLVVLIGTPWRYSWGGHMRFNRNGKDLFNAAVLIYQGRIEDAYAKIELPNYGVFDEKRYFVSPDVPTCLIFTMGGLRFYITICEDVWIDNSPVMIMAGMNDVDINLNLSASPFFAGKMYHGRLQALRHFCNRTGSMMFYNNLIGGQDELTFDGSGMIIDAKGNLKALGKRFEEDLLITDVNPEMSELLNGKERIGLRDYYQTRDTSERTFAVKYEVRDTGKCHVLSEQDGIVLKDSLPTSQDASADLKEVYEALRLGTGDYVRKNGFEKVIVGLSGGIDSALVFAIAVDALGPDCVVAVTMPSKVTSKETLEDAFALMDNFGVTNCFRLDINSVVEAYTGVLINNLDKKLGVTFENLQARIRGNLLMALSNDNGWLVLTTGNKSELAVGYCTLYGDMAGGFAVIKDVPKTLVYELAAYVNSAHGRAVIPQSVIDRAPSAELSEGQTDERELGEYSNLDVVLRAYIEHDSTPKEIGASIDEDYSRDTINRTDRNEYKRRQAPPGIKITPRAFGKDRRFPITNHWKEV